MSFQIKKFHNESKWKKAIFAKLDDYDIVAAMKLWRNHTDFVLSNLCQMILDRDLLKIKIKNKPIKISDLETHHKVLMDKYSISKEEADYFVFSGEITNVAYQSKKQHIN